MLGLRNVAEAMVPMRYASALIATVDAHEQPVNS